MKTMIIIIVMVAGLIGLINLLSNRTLRTEITINAASDKVWDELMNHSEYTSWNPFIKHISGSTKPGSQLFVIIQAEGQKPMEFKPHVLVNKPGKEFRWLGQFIVTGIMDGEHFFKIEQLSPNQTRLVQGESFTGILSGIFAQLIGTNTQSGFEQMNSAIKSRIEGDDMIKP